MKTNPNKCLLPHAKLANLTSALAKLKFSEDYFNKALAWVLSKSFSKLRNTIKIEFRTVVKTTPVMDLDFKETRLSSRICST